MIGLLIKKVFFKKAEKSEKENKMLDFEKKKKSGGLSQSLPFHGDSVCTMLKRSRPDRN